MTDLILAALTLAPDAPRADPLAGWPLWLQVTVGIAAGGAALWLLLKLLRIGFWLLLIALLVSAVAFFLRESGLLFISHR